MEERILTVKNSGTAVLPDIILLHIAAVALWAENAVRSVNCQIEHLLTE